MGNENSHLRQWSGLTDLSLYPRPALGHIGFGPDFPSHGFKGLSRRADKDDPLLLARLGEFPVLCQKSISRMNGVCFGLSWLSLKSYLVQDTLHRKVQTPRSKPHPHNGRVMPSGRIRNRPPRPKFLVHDRHGGCEPRFLLDWQ